MPRIKKTEKPLAEKYIFAVGRRKEAVARVRLYEGKGEMVVNNRPIEQYFAGEASKIIYLSPFLETQSLERFHVSARIVGGGISGQLGAFIHGVSRALTKVNQDFKPSLKKKGLLTRDSRTRERRKVGTGGKARRKKQSPKR